MTKYRPVKIFINVEEQDGTEAVCLNSPVWGYLSIDGMEVPEGRGGWLYGTYLDPGLIELEGTLIDINLDVNIELSGSKPTLADTSLDLDDGYDTTTLTMGKYPDCIEFSY